MTHTIADNELNLFVENQMSDWRYPVQYDADVFESRIYRVPKLRHPLCWTLGADLFLALMVTMICL